MYKSIKYWIVLLLGIIHLSFFSDLPTLLYESKSYPAKVEAVKEKFQKGIVLPLFALEEDYPYLRNIDEISSLGARSISFFVTNYQEDIRSNVIYLNQRAAEPLQLARLIDYAHSRGLSVFLFPTLHLQHLGYKEWRGVLKPADYEKWWESYFHVVRYYLMIARDHDVELFSIGSELCAQEWDYSHWSKLIKYCRTHYSGVLTYSANWDHFHNISFVKDLDFLGMNAYFGLTQKDNPTLEDLLVAWKPAKKRFEEAYAEYKTRILITEIGYPSVNGANRDPWNYFSTSKLDLDEQALCYKAFVETWDPPPSFLHGVYFYNWWGDGGLSDRDYTPRFKPAEKILRKWYKSL